MLKEEAWILLIKAALINWKSSLLKSVKKKILLLRTDISTKKTRCNMLIKGKCQLKKAKLKTFWETNTSSSRKSMKRLEPTENGKKTLNLRMVSLLMLMKQPGVTWEKCLMILELIDKLLDLKMFQMLLRERMQLFMRVIVTSRTSQTQDWLWLTWLIMNTTSQLEMK